jgi:hypothetical protein
VHSILKEYKPSLVLNMQQVKEINCRAEAVPVAVGERRV